MFFDFDVRWHFAFFVPKKSSPCFYHLKHRHVWRCLPPKALDAKENGAVLGTTRILDGMLWYYQYLNLKRPSRYVVCFLLQGRAMSLKGGSLGANSYPGTSPWLRTNMDVKSQNTLLLRTAFNFQPDSNTWARTNRCSQQCDFPDKKWQIYQIDGWLFLDCFLRSVVFRPVNFQQFGASRSDHFSPRDWLWKTMINTGESYLNRAEEKEMIL